MYLEVYKQRMKIKSYEEIKAFRNYQFNVDPLAVPISKIITDYELIDEIACGIKSCHQPHRYGYLVELEDGCTTNVGSTCGRHFKDFDAKRDIYNREHRKVILIEQIRKQKPAVLAKRALVDAVQAQETALFRQRNNFIRLLPSLAKDLTSRLQKRAYVVTKVRKRSAEEVEKLKALNTSIPTEKLLYEETTIGQFRGLLIFDLSVGYVIRNLKQAIDELDNVLLLQDLGYQKLSDIGSLIENFDENLEKVQRELREAESFFSNENFQLFRKLDLAATEQKLLNRLSTTDFSDPDKKLKPPPKANIDPSKSMMVRMMRKLWEDKK